MYWSAGQRGKCIAKGLRYWKLRESDVSGLRYLGAIAIQGGLPMQLLAEAKGNLGRMLRKVLKLAAGGAELRQIRGWIKRLEDYLPKSYRQEEVYRLLAEVIETVLSLKGEAQLTTSSEAVSQLDHRVPGWRSRFPLPVEDGEIQGLIEQLIRDVTEQRPVRSGRSVVIQRWLNNADADIWSLCSSIEMPDVLQEQEIRALFDLADDPLLPRHFELVFVVADYQRSYSARKIAGHDAYRVEIGPRELDGVLAVAEHRLILRFADGQRWRINLRKGEMLDSELPWLFEHTSEQLPRLIRQGGGNVLPTDIFVAIPPGATIEPADSASCVMEAFLDNPEREVYSIRGTAVVNTPTGRRSTIRTGCADASEESFQWRGERLWLDFIQPGAAFCGRPKLTLLYGEEGVQRIADRDVSWSHPGDVVGPVTAFFEEKGELRHQAKMVVLPREAAIEYEAVDADQGIIHLRQWRLAGVSLAEETIADIQLKRDGDSLSIHCRTNQSVTPEWLEFDLSWEANTKAARVRLPFPAEGARAFDATGAALAADSWLSVQHLAGVRLVSFCRSHIPVEMILQLRHTKERKNEQEIRRRIQPVAGVSRLDIRLQDYAEDIQQLLAADELLDAWVEVALYINNRSALSIRVSRYSCRLKRLSSEVFINSQHLKDIAQAVLESLPVHALRLEHPADESVLLPCQKSQGVPTGAWDFDPGSKEPGAWLIYPGAESGISFRPTLWLVAGDSKASTPLANALAIENREERAIAMDSVITTMAADFCDPSWEGLEQLSSHLGHLPLATLDVWRRFVHSPDGMAALALRMSHLPDGFLRRFSVEQPFVWEMLPLQSWINAAQQLKVQSKAWFGDKLDQRQLEDHLCARVEGISDFSPALGKLLGIVKSLVLEDNCKEVAMMRHPDTDNVFKEQLDGVESSPLRRLFRDHADDKWPNDSTIFYAINAVRKKSKFSHLFIEESYNFKDGVIGLPILLAIQVATNSTDNWFSHAERIHTLRTYMAFDQEWFTEAFDLTIARCLSTGIMQI